jgi:hypothetical protein
MAFEEQFGDCGPRFQLVDGVSASAGRMIPCSCLFTSSVLIVAKKSLMAFSIRLSRSFFLFADDLSSLLISSSLYTSFGVSISL